MPSKKPADDLFEQSSMSFGEHLEELRKALLKAFIWLGIGTAIGLYFADSIVKYLQVPLEQAFQDFRVEEAKKAFEKANGAKPTDDLAKMMRDISVIPEIRYVDPAVLKDSYDHGQALAAETEPQLADEDGKKKETPQKETAAKEKAPKAAPSPATKTETDTLSTEGLKEIDPWEGIDRAALNRLRPIIVWKPNETKMVSFQATEGFMIWLKAGVVAGVVIGSPGIFWHIWQFFAAGLYPHERRYIYWYLPMSLLLFLAGVALAFAFVFRLVLGFLMTYTSNLGVEFTPRLSDYMSFVLFLPLGFGIAFQLPMVMLGLHRFGIVSVELFISQWRIAVLAIAFLSMLLTPAEPYSMVGLAVPLTALYFVGILLCKYMPRGAGIGSQALDPQN